jgi:hypothetical protein
MYLNIACICVSQLSTCFLKKHLKLDKLKLRSCLAQLHQQPHELFEAVYFKQLFAGSFVDEAP